MSVTEQQKAYHLRKVRTRLQRLDINQDGYISREDFELMGKRLIEYSSDITKEKSETILATFATIPDLIGLKPGVKIPLEEMAKIGSDTLLSGKKPPGVHDMLFDCIDTNNNGTISIEEYKVYFQVIGPNISDEEMKHSFNTIDSNGDGVISRDEFLAAAEDFFYGVEETELSNVFYGKLVP
jgi:Ca2+-binding EF-hand superfamily protein